MKRGTGSALTMSLGAAALVSFVATYAYGLGLPKTVEQEDYSKLIAIHPGVAWASYVGFGVMAVASVLWLWPRTRSLTWDLLAGASAEVAVLFTTLTLITGSIWGRPTWGVWWVWDARLTLSALMLTLLLGYLAMRRVPSDVDVRARRSAVAALLAVLVVPVNHFAVEWWRTLHQGRSLSQVTPNNSLDGQFIFAMVLGFLSMTLVCAWLTIHRLRVAQLEEDVVGDDLDAALAAR
ncbi:MAG: ABC-type transport system involved in cytochrome c biosis, permease component, partial [Acidimicrobiales bacterium]|nr:ABC-type transport system involved in cytochrome c biosis, permease component [Acidimicrobiales bacterium]